MGKRGQDETDSELWARVAATATPLKKGRAATPSKPAAPDAKPSAPVKRNAGPAASKTVPKAPKSLTKSVPRGGALDRQMARKLDKGRLAVEARLDLHGMKQKDAHAALRRFLKSAHAKGHRHVLVITGKGAVLEESRSFYAEDERGVLRQAVPHWLSQPDLADLVISFAEAPRRLGSAGALYIRLRRPH
jgi:DNA-nicking Smr family endonuclease